jgi:iron complex transport system substrate-binding protein
VKRLLLVIIFALGYGLSQTYPVTIENCGRTLTYTKAPERVFVTYPSVAHILYRLGLGERVIGSEWHEDVRIPEDVAAQHAKVPNQYERWISKEEFFALEPDFVFSAYDIFDFEPTNGSPALEDVLAAGINVYAVEGECGGGTGVNGVYDTLYNDIANIGKIFGVEEKAQTLVAELQGRVAVVQEKVAGLEPVKVFIYYGGEGPLGSFTNGRYGDMVRLAGGESIFLDATTTAMEVSAEEVAARNPDVFVLVVPTGDDGSAMAEFLFETFPTTEAGMNRRAVPVLIGFPAGVSNVDAIETMARGFHPEASE